MATEQMKFVLSGDRAEAAADQMAAALAIPAADLKRSAPVGLPDGDRKVVDPISLATLILSIPPALLAAMDLVDRVAKRRKAADVIDAAKRAKIEMNVDVALIGRGGASQSVASMNPDDLLEAASSPAPPPA